MALLEVNDLKVYYKTGLGVNKAVDGISFQLEEGKSLGLVGESGCGKSTTAKGLIQVMPRNAFIAGGKVLFKEENLLTLSENRLRRLRWNEIAMVPQASMDSLNPVYTVSDQFLEILKLKGKMSHEEAKARAKELFKMVGLDSKRLDNYPHEFSGGMKQRAVIALALALNPKLVIADEPVTALDVIVQRQVLNELKNLRRQLGISLIMITHDISVVAETCDYTVVMYAGKIVEKGLTGEILKKPMHPYTMGLKNAFPNLKQKDKTLISIEGSPPDLLKPPTGCRFAERCPFAITDCQKEPELIEVFPGHYSACIRLAEIEQLRKDAGEVETWQKKDM